MSRENTEQYFRDKEEEQKKARKQIYEAFATQLVAKGTEPGTDEFRNAVKKEFFGATEEAIKEVEEYVGRMMALEKKELGGEALEPHQQEELKRFQKDVENLRQGRWPG